MFVYFFLFIIYKYILLVILIKELIIYISLTLVYKIQSIYLSLTNIQNLRILRLLVVFRIRIELL